MPITAPPQTAASVENAADRPPAQFWMFRGVAAYMPHTPWKPLGGIAATIAIFAGAILLVGVVVATAWANNRLPTDVLVMLAATLVQQVGVIAFTWFAANRYGAKPISVLALRTPAQGLKSYAIAFVLLIGLTLVVGFAVQLFDKDAAKADVEIYKAMITSSWWWLALIVVGIGAPVSEELLFRGFLFSALANSRIGRSGAAVITSLGFALVHPYSIVGITQVFLIGMLFAWILIRTGSLRVTIVCHAVFNTAQALLMLANIEI
jgi:uncharacterized protein